MRTKDAETEVPEQSVVLTQQQKDFILNEVIPYVEREEGHGFDMGLWADNVSEFYGVIKPSCGTVACIGGSMDMIITAKQKKLEVQKLNANLIQISWEAKEKASGLTPAMQDGLFCNYLVSDVAWAHKTNKPGYKEGRIIACWPRDAAEAHAKAKTAKQKAAVACTLLKRVVETNGQCLLVAWQMKHPRWKYDKEQGR